VDIPGLSTLYSILKRDIDRRNDIFRQRQELSSELMDNCRRWSEVLVSTFRGAVNRWTSEGREAAANDIVALEMDFLKLDYYSLESSSPILSFLREDSNFRAFADACADFYKSALSVKRIVYGDIQTHPGVYVSEGQIGIRGMVNAWENEVERMLREVGREYMKVRVLSPR
jgi:hypothetical protein